MANSSNPASDRSADKDEGPKWTIPCELKPRRLICLLPESHPNSARLAARHPFTWGFLLITASLPAKYMIAKGLAPHISLARMCGAAAARTGMEVSHPIFTRLLSGRGARLPCEAQYGTTAACVRRPIRNL